MAPVKKKKKKYLHSKIRNRSSVQRLNLGPVFNLFISSQRTLVVLGLLVVINFLLTAVYRGQNLNLLILRGILPLTGEEIPQWGSKRGKFILIEMFFIGHKIPLVTMGSLCKVGVIHSKSKKKDSKSNIKGYKIKADRKC